MAGLVTPSPKMDCVYLVDDDDSIRESLSYVLTKAGFVVRSFCSPSEFLEEFDGDDCGCVVLDLKMPGMTGLELAATLNERGIHRPFVMLTGYGTVSSAVDAMRLGASDFIEKPVEHNRLIECIRTAVLERRLNRESNSTRIKIDIPENLLTHRERQITMMVIDGLLTKQIASQLSISIKTVDVHRSNIMKKIGVTSIAQLMKKVISPT